MLTATQRHYVFVFLTACVLMLSGFMEAHELETTEQPEKYTDLHYPDDIVDLGLPYTYYPEPDFHDTRYP